MGVWSVNASVSTELSSASIESSSDFEGSTPRWNVARDESSTCTAETSIRKQNSMC
jgi:hypothetical protein